MAYGVLQTPIKQGKYEGEEKMYWIAVCDDEAVSRRHIVNAIRKVLPESIAKIVEYSDGSDLLYDIEEQQHFDIIMLDISMRDMDGMTVAYNIRKGSVCSSSIIFFITSYEADISRVVDLNPMAYIYKPVTDKNMKEKLKKAVKVLQRNGGVLEFVADRQEVRVMTESITYIEGGARWVFIHTQKEVYKTYTYKISDMAPILDSIDFIRCHNSYIVNENYIKRVSASYIEMYDEQKIPISRKYRKEVFDILEE